MQIPNEILKHCKQTIGVSSGFSPASGGCINNGGTVKTVQGMFFIKWNDAKRFPNMFTVESKGLGLLAQTKAIKIPEVISVYEGESYSCLILENIQASMKTSDYNGKLGEGLADIHHHCNETYGLDHTNYIGSLLQYNQPTENWPEFFYHQRIKPQVDLALKNKQLSQADADQFHLLKEKLSQLLPSEKPSLIHGDLWGGNVMTDRYGEPVLIDPAVAYSHREMDIAMTRLFGGFDQQFYNAYNCSYPLISGFEDRLDLYNLYPVLVHVNLFGGSYRNQAMHIVSKYTK